LNNAGPGNTVALFVSVSAISAIAHWRYVERKLVR
jgi:hypothetical protein